MSRNGLPDVLFLESRDEGAQVASGGDLRKSPRGTPAPAPALTENRLGHSFSPNGSALLPIQSIHHFSPAFRDQR